MEGTLFCFWRLEFRVRILQKRDCILVIGILCFEGVEPGKGNLVHALLCFMVGGELCIFECIPCERALPDERLFFIQIDEVKRVFNTVTFVYDWASNESQVDLVFKASGQISFVKMPVGNASADKSDDLSPGIEQLELLFFTGIAWLIKGFHLKDRFFDVIPVGADKVA